MDYLDKGQLTTAEHAEPEAKLDFAQKDVTREITKNESSEEDIDEEKDQIEKDNKSMPIPIRCVGKWAKEKKATRSTSREARKLNWLGNNVMVARIEKQSSVGESQQSVYETEAPRRNQTFEAGTLTRNCPYIKL